MNQGEKRTTQRIPLTDANGGYNNKKIALREVMSQGPSPLKIQNQRSPSGALNLQVLQIEKPQIKAFMQQDLKTQNTTFQTQRAPNMAPCPLGLQNLRGLKKIPKYEALHVPLGLQKSKGHLEELYIQFMTLPKTLIPKILMGESYKHHGLNPNPWEKAMHSMAIDVGCCCATIQQYPLNYIKNLII